MFFPAIRTDKGRGKINVPSAYIILDASKAVSRLLQSPPHPLHSSQKLGSFGEEEAEVGGDTPCVVSVSGYPALTLPKHRLNIGQPLNSPFPFFVGHWWIPSAARISELRFS